MPTTPPSSSKGRSRRGLLVVGALLVTGVAALAVASAANLPVSTQKVTGFKTCTITAYPTASTAAIDAYVRQDSSANNFGVATDLSIQSRSARNWRAFVRFDLTKCSPAVPAGSTVKVATLRLYVYDDPPSTRSYEARRVVTPCPEGLATCWGQTTLTWNNQPAAAATATSTVSVCTGAACNNKYYNWPVTADVQGFVAGTASNYGWRIGDSVEGDASGILMRFRSRENNSVVTAPQLVITYTP